MARTEDRREDRRSKPLIGRFTNFTPLIAPIDQVLMQIKDDTSECYDLKQQIEALIKQGKLQQFVSKERADPP